MKTNFEGIEIGAVTVKWIRKTQDGTIVSEIKPHGGNPTDTIQGILNTYSSLNDSCAVVTGQATKALFDLPYRSQTECLEKAVSKKWMLFQ